MFVDILFVFFSASFLIGDEVSILSEYNLLQSERFQIPENTNFPCKIELSLTQNFFLHLDKFLFGTLWGSKLKIVSNPR